MRSLARMATAGFSLLNVESVRHPVWPEQCALFTRRVFRQYAVFAVRNHTVIKPKAGL